MQKRRWKCKHLRSVKRWGEEGDWINGYKKEKQCDEEQQNDGTETKRKMTKNNKKKIIFLWRFHA